MDRAAGWTETDGHGQNWADPPTLKVSRSAQLGLAVFVSSAPSGEGHDHCRGRTLARNFERAGICRWAKSRDLGMDDDARRGRCVAHDRGRAVPIGRKPEARELVAECRNDLLDGAVGDEDGSLAGDLAPDLDALRQPQPHEQRMQIVGGGAAAGRGVCWGVRLGRRRDDRRCGTRRGRREHRRANHHGLRCGRAGFAKERRDRAVLAALLSLHAFGLDAPHHVVALRGGVPADEPEADGRGCHDQKEGVLLHPGHGIGGRCRFHAGGAGCSEGSPYADGVSAADLVLVLVSVVMLVVVAALAVTVVQLRHVLGDLRDATASFTAHVAPVIAELTDAAHGAADQVERLDDLIGVAGAVTSTVDSATAATVRVLSSPVIRTAAIARGTRRAARRLRAGDED